MKWQNNFQTGEELVLVTASKKAVPNANIVISLGFIDEQLVLADCQMKQTLKNLQENPSVCVLGKYLRLTGKVKIFSKGKFLDLCKQKTTGYEVKNAIVITVKNVYDLDKGKLIFGN